MTKENKKGETLLIIGNGFDLAHGLPTKYTDFLEFCKCVELIFDEKIDKDEFKYELEKWNPQSKNQEENIAEIEENIKIIQNNITEKKENKAYLINSISENLVAYNKHLKDDKDPKKKQILNSISKIIKNTQEIKNKLLDAFASRQKDKNEQFIKINDSTIDKIHKLITNNFWYQYLIKTYRQNRIKNNNWVSFESEIKYIIKKIDEQSENELLKKFQKIFPEIQEKDPKFKNIYFDRELEHIIIENKTLIKNCKTIGDFRDKSYEALLELIQALEIYFSVFIEKLEISEEIKKQCIKELKPDDVINFNYTHTYESNYGELIDKNKIYYIHGECNYKENTDKNDNNLVLGIDEYWEKEEEKDNYTNFTIFKKFAQRIQKQTDVKQYLKFIKELEDKLEEKIYKIYIFGHSLDVTDKDILEKFFSSKTTDITIYSYSTEEIGNLIANTIKLIGKEKFQKKLREDKIRYLLY